MAIKEIIRDLIDDLRMAIPGGRQFLDKSKDTSEHDVNEPMAIVDTTIELSNVDKIVVKANRAKR